MSHTEKPSIHAVSLPHPNELLVIEPLDYSNPYDFNSLHRHDYFEIILIKHGQGTQLIDFLNYEMKEQQVFSVYTGQVHLMHRDTAQGLLIQFRKNIFEHLHPLKHFHVYFANPAFSLDQDQFSHIYDLTERIQNLLHQTTLDSLSKQKAYNYLQIILISLVEQRNDKKDILQQSIVAEFLYLLTEHIYTKKKVSEYCALMKCHADKLNIACKNTLGKPALQLIHEEVLLEIKRLLLLDRLSLKEIAYELNFDSQANFSGFTKARTNMSPSELQHSVREIYK